MYHELHIYNRNLDNNEARNLIFAAIEHNLHGISIPTPFLPIAQEIVPQGIVVASPIDYPNGMSDSKTREHAVILAIRKGANAIDLVSPSSPINNEDYD